MAASSGVRLEAVARVTYLTLTAGVKALTVKKYESSMTRRWVSGAVAGKMGGAAKVTVGFGVWFDPEACCAKTACEFPHIIKQISNVKPQSGSEAGQSVFIFKVLLFIANTFPLTD